MVSTHQSSDAEPAAPPVTDATEPVEDLARHVGENVCRGFRAHDRGDRDACLAAFFEVDRHQFCHLSDRAAHAAATAYVDALWAKDAVEAPHVRDDGTLDRASLAAADWGPVEAPLARRADIVGMDAEYASATTDGWRKHKTGGDYWTPHMVAQRHEVRAALDDPDYPHKRGSCRSGVGPLPARYLVGIELHDMKSDRHWGEAADVMQAYYADLLRGQRGRTE